jgi:hypothetical protein
MSLEMNIHVDHPRYRSHRSRRGQRTALFSRTGKQDAVGSLLFDMLRFLLLATRSCAWVC